MGTMVKEFANKHKWVAGFIGGTLALSVSLWLFMPQRNVGSLQVPNWQNRVDFMSTTSLVTAGTLAAAGTTMVLPSTEIPDLVKPMKTTLPDAAGYLPCLTGTSAPVIKQPVTQQPTGGQPGQAGLGQQSNTDVVVTTQTTTPAANNNSGAADKPKGENEGDDNDNSGSKAWVWIIVLLILAGLGVGAYFMFFRKTADEDEIDQLDDGYKSEV